MLYLSCTLLTSMQAFPCARWSHVWMSNVMISSLTRNYICMLKWLVLPSQFLALRYDHMMGIGNAIFTLVWHNRWNCSLCTVHWNILWHLFITPQCSWLLAWPSCYIVSSCVEKINIKNFVSCWFRICWKYMPESLVCIRPQGENWIHRPVNF